MKNEEFVFTATNISKLTKPICKQKAFRVLRELEPMSLILFGSCIKNEFCLDTLFVVSNDQERYRLDNIESVFPQRNQFYHASINPIYDDINYNPNVSEEDNCRIAENEEFTFYKGVSYDEREDNHGLYSFVPSKVYNYNSESAFAFKQPKIDLDFIQHSQTQGLNAGSGKDYTIEEIKQYWKLINDQIEKEGLLQGVKFKTPELKLN